MRGATHFVSGIAAGTLVPEVVPASLLRSPVLLLAGAYAMLPDIIDFKIYKYFVKFDYELELDHKTLDPEPIAKAVAKAIREAWDNPGKEVKVHFRALKVSADLWRKYTIIFDTENRKLVVKVGGLVTFAGDEYVDEHYGKKAEVEMEVPVKWTYSPEVNVTILSGTDISFVRKGDVVEVVFLPYHRNKYHSFTAGLLFSFLIALPLWFINLPITGDLLSLFTVVHPLWRVHFYTLVLTAFAGYAAHIITDQFGFMGSNLFWPFTKERTPGLKIGHAIDPLPNIVCGWLSLLLIIWNFNACLPDRFNLNPLHYFGFELEATTQLTLSILGTKLFELSLDLEPVLYFGLLGVVPTLLLAAANKLYKKYFKPEEEVELDVVLEMKEEAEGI